MGTRSTIAIEFADGSVSQVYCHWDGYLAHNGDLLNTHYRDPFKVRDLIDQGSISSLGCEIGSKRPFGPAYSEQDPVKKAAVQAAIDAADAAGWSIIYARDRGEDLDVNRYQNADEYFDCSQQEEYDYILRNVNGIAVWYVRCDATGNTWVTMAEAFETQKEAA